MAFFPAQPLVAAILSRSRLMVFLAFGRAPGCAITARTLAEARLESQGWDHRASGAAIQALTFIFAIPSRRLV